MQIRRDLTCVVVAVLSSACSGAGLFTNGSRNVTLPASSASFQPLTLALGVGQRVPLTLFIHSRLGFSRIDLMPESGVTLSDFACEPAGSCPVERSPDPENGSTMTTLHMYGARSIAMTVTGVRAGHTSISTELFAPEPCESGHCTYYYAYPRVEIEVGSSLGERP